jgi:hypothetical protein
MCIDEKVPDWTGLPIIDGLLLSCEFQSSLEDIIAGVPWKQKPPVKLKCD